MSRVVNSQIALLLSGFSPAIVFAPAFDFNYLTGPGSVTIHEITRNLANKAASCGFVDRLSGPADLKIGEVGRYSSQLFSCSASGPSVYSKTRKSSARTALPSHSTAITPSALTSLSSKYYKPLEFP